MIRADSWWNKLYFQAKNYPKENQEMLHEKKSMKITLTFNDRDFTWREIVGQSTSCCQAVFRCIQAPATEIEAYKNYTNSIFWLFSFSKLKWTFSSLFYMSLAILFKHFFRSSLFLVLRREMKLLFTGGLKS